MINKLPNHLICMIAAKIENRECLINFAKTNKYIYHCINDSENKKMQSIFPNFLVKFIKQRFYDNKILMQDFKDFKLLTKEPGVRKEAIARAYSSVLKDQKWPLIATLKRHSHFDLHYISKQSDFKMIETLQIHPIESDIEIPPLQL